MLDATYRVQIRHRAGQLAKVARTIAESQGVIGDVTTVRLGREATIRELTVEAHDEDHAEDIAGQLNALDGVEGLWHRDRALMRHEEAS